MGTRRDAHRLQAAPRAAPGVPHAVQAEATRQRAIATAAIVCAVAVIVGSLRVDCMAKPTGSPPPLMQDITTEVDILGSDRPLPLIGGATPRRHLR